MKIFGRNISFAPWYKSLLQELDLEIFELKENTIENNVSLFTASRIISDNMSTLEIKLFKKVKGEKVEATDDPRYFLLNRRPNNQMNFQVWRSNMVYEIIDTGDAFSRIHREDNDKSPNFGGPKSLEFITNVDRTKIFTDDNGVNYYILIDKKGEELEKVKFRDMIHLRGFGNGIFGQSVKEVLGTQVNINELIYKTFEKHYKGGGRPEMFLKSSLTGRGSENVDKSIDEWEKDGRTKTRKGGFRRIPGNTDLIPWAVNLQESQALDTVKHNKTDIATLLGVPPFMLGDFAGGNFKSVEFLTRFFTSQTIRPNAKIWIAEFDNKLLTDKEWRDGMRFKFNTNELIETDFATKGDWYQKMVMNGSINNKLVCETEGWPVPPNADDYLVSNNHTPYTEFKEKMDLANQKLEAEIEKLKAETVKAIKSTR